MNHERPAEVNPKRPVEVSEDTRSAIGQAVEGLGTIISVAFRASPAWWRASHLREWRNRQTRTVQVRVSERTWGFNSPLAHNSPRSSDLGL